ERLRGQARAVGPQVQRGRAVRGAGGPPEATGGEPGARVVAAEGERAKRPGEVVPGRQRQQARAAHPRTVPPPAAAAVAAARASVRCSSRGSPSIARSRFSRPPIGTRFCGARGSLYGDDANRGSVTADRSASATAAGTGNSAGHSRRTMPDHGPPAGPGSRRYHEYACQIVPWRKTGERCPGASAVTTADRAAGRYW